GKIRAGKPTGNLNDSGARDGDQGGAQALDPASPANPRLPKIGAPLFPHGCFPAGHFPAGAPLSRRPLRRPLRPAPPPRPSDGQLSGRPCPAGITPYRDHALPGSRPTGTTPYRDQQAAGPRSRSLTARELTPPPPPPPRPRWPA